MLPTASRRLLGSDAVGELGTVIMISTIVILIVLKLLSKDLPPATGQDFSIYLRKGLFRFWVVSSGLWIIVCATNFYLHCSRDSYKFFVGRTYVSPSYLDIGEWFVAIPALAFVIGLAACWAIDGFRRSNPN